MSTPANAPEITLVRKTPVASDGLGESTAYSLTAMLEFESQLAQANARYLLAQRRRSTLTASFSYVPANLEVKENQF